MLLTAFLIGGQTVGVQLEEWERSDLLGNPPFKAETTISAGYADITTLVNWSNFWRGTGLSCKDFRNELINAFLPDWATLIDADKQILVRNYVYPVTETTANLDLLYTQAERDQFLLDVVAVLNNSGENFQPAPDGNVWNVLPDIAGSLVTTKLKTDEVI